MSQISSARYDSVGLVKCSRRQFVQLSVSAAAAPAVVACSSADEPITRPQGVPLSSFTKESLASEVVSDLDLRGRHILITGGTSGLGLESARALSARGASVWLTGRSLAKAQTVCQQIGGDCRPLELELERPDSIVECAQRFKQAAIPLDALICNAGIMVVGERRLVGSVEQHFAVNHLGHFLLVHHLIEDVKRASQGRVVIVGSSAYKWAPPAGIEFDNLDGSRDFTPNKAYGQSKLANALFSLELARRLQGTSVTSNSLNPGAADTELWRHYPRWQQWLLAPVKGFLLKTPEQAAATQCYVTTAPALADTSGYYFEDCNPVVPPVQVRDVDLAGRLWDTSEELLRDYL